MGLDLGMIIRGSRPTAGELLCLVSEVWTRGDMDCHNLEGGPQPESENWLWVNSVYVSDEGLCGSKLLRLWKNLILQKVALADSLLISRDRLNSPDTLTEEKPPSHVNKPVTENILPRHHPPPSPWNCAV